jgi:hypothetical protein
MNKIKNSTNSIYSRKQKIPEMVELTEIILGKWLVVPALEVVSRDFNGILIK